MLRGIKFTGNIYAGSTLLCLLLLQGEFPPQDSFYQDECSGFASPPSGLLPGSGQGPLRTLFFINTTAYLLEKSN